MTSRDDAEKERKSQPCPFCKGTGRCFKCDGEGVRFVSPGRLKRRFAATCSVCEGTGKCQLCRESGDGSRD